jgi:peptide/nickel transport system substrate-binding protein
MHDPGTSKHLLHWGDPDIQYFFGNFGVSERFRLVNVRFSAAHASLRPNRALPERIVSMLRVILPIAFTLFCGAVAAAPLHGIAMHGQPALPPDYKHFSYVNPDVKKGGRITYGVVGTFDNLNPFILKSMRTTARGMWDPEYGNLVYESLMQRSRDEPFTLYGLLAETVEWDEDRTFIQFNLNPKAKWSDGQPVTPEDVIFSFELLRDKGRVPFASRLRLVSKL